MNKNEAQIMKRTGFIQLCLQDPKKGAEQMNELAASLSECKTGEDVIWALSEILYLSTRTIERSIIDRHYGTSLCNSRSNALTLHQ